jgi:hypothetical protein
MRETMKKFGMFVSLFVLGISILACGWETASQVTPVAQNVAPTNMPLVDLPNHEAFLLANGFTYSPSFTSKCLGPCQAYFNEKYIMRVELYDNGDITIVYSETYEFLDQAQAELASRLVDSFFGPEVLSWVVDNLIKSFTNEQTADINGYRFFIRAVSQPKVIVMIIATPLH